MCYYFDANKEPIICLKKLFCFLFKAIFVENDGVSVNYEKILKEFSEGKESAMQQLYDFFFVPLCAYGSRFIPNQQTVADIVQEVFIKMWDRRKDFYSIFSLRTFLYTSVRNGCLNELRNQKRRGQKVEITEITAFEDRNLIIEEEVFRMISMEIAALPPAMRGVFELGLLDLKVKEIAEILNISEQTVKNQRATAKKKLQERLQNWMFLFFL